MRFCQMFPGLLAIFLATFMSLGITAGDMDPDTGFFVRRRHGMRYLRASPAENDETGEMQSFITGLVWLLKKSGNAPPQAGPQAGSSDNTSATEPGRLSSTTNDQSTSDRNEVEVPDMGNGGDGAAEADIDMSSDGTSLSETGRMSTTTNDNSTSG